MQAIARLVDELRTSAVANLVVGDAALVVAAFRADSPGRAIVLFAVVTCVLALVSGRLGPNGRIRRELARAAQPAAGSGIEAFAATRRRVIIGLVPVAVILAVLVGVAPESAAVIAGVPAGVGSGDMWMLGWVRKFEGERGDTALREVGSSPFVASNRPVYTLPMNAETDET